MSILLHPDLPAITLPRGEGQGAAPDRPRQFYSGLCIADTVRQEVLGTPLAVFHCTE